MGKEDSIPKFKPDNYPDWSFKMAGHLLAKGVFGSIDLVSNEWETKTDPQKQAMRLKAFNEILKSLAEHSSVARTFQHHQAQQLWNHIRTEFDRNTLSNQLDLNEEFINFKHKGGEDVESFLIRFDDLVNRLRAIGLPQDNNICFLRLLKAFPDSLEGVRQNLIVNGQYDIANARRLARRFSSSFSQPSDSILRIGGKNRDKLNKHVCQYCRKSGHSRFKCSIRLADEKLGLHLPNRDAPWRAQMEETIQKRIDEAFRKGLAEGKQEKQEEEPETENETMNLIQEAYDEAYDETDGFSFL